MSDNFQIPVKLKISDESIDKIRDRLGSNEELSSITVKMEATHSGIVNGNNWFYVNDGMERGAKSFIKPFFRPVTYEHLDDSPTLGRVIDAKYIDYGISPESIRDSSVTGFYKNVKDYVKASSIKDSKYKGTGHIELVAKITDKVAIQKVLNREFIGVSVGGKTDKAICSVCGTDNKSGSCSHERGRIYDKQKCFYIGGLMKFDHVTYTAIPADKNATSTIIKDSEDVSTSLDILDFEITIKDNSMKYNLADLESSNDSLVEYAEKLNIKDKLSIPAPEDTSAIDYLFGEAKTYPIADSLSAAVVMKFLSEEVQESEDLPSAMAIVKDKLAELGVDDYEQVIKDAAKEEEKEPEKPAIDIEELVGKIVDKLQQVLTIDGGFSQSRLRAVQTECRDLHAQNAELKSELKDSLVSQICNIEKIEDSATIEKLKSRTILSLKDKLEDLNSEEKEEDHKVEDKKEDKVLEPESANIEDKAEDDIKDSEKNPEDKDESDETPKVEFMDSKDVKKGYKEAIRKDGLGAGPKYIQSLKEQGLVPADFKL